LKKLVPKLRSVSSMVMAPPSTGSDKTSKERRHQHRPDEKRHLVKRHARGAHVEDGRDEIDRAQDRGRTGQVQREDRQIDSHIGMPLNVGERRINRPARTGTGRETQQMQNQNLANNISDGTISQKEMLLRRGKAMSGAPIMMGRNQLPKPPISPGMTTKKTMMRPCAVMNTFHCWPSATTCMPGCANSRRMIMDRPAPTMPPLPKRSGRATRYPCGWWTGTSA
jgi:hypothetical protein